MDNASFKRLAAVSRRKWDKVRGLLVRLDNGPGTVNLRLTAGPSANSGLVLEQVSLWEGGRICRSCQPGDKELQKDLTSSKVCRAYVMYVDECTRNWRPVKNRWMCLGRPCTCKVKGCPARGRTDVE